MRQQYFIEIVAVILTPCTLTYSFLKIMAMDVC